ncbi:FMN-binding protein [Nocardioides sp. Soil805]|uniref:FMN-binding protein n=1 Tax=Nocardioides sp. Soil805 TaxID=1736416 RepID=UPI000702E104|nr:FMN-binding protein [Nocardioides sp. Soil805]KRF36787.1 FMN-binding protein [Nocardioides sp. Soil805]
MRRIVLWFASTAVVLMLLAGYHTSFAGPLATHSTISAYSAGTLADPATSGASPSPASGSAGSGSGSTGSGSTSSGSTGSGSTGSGSTGSGSSSSGSTSTTVTGDTVQTQWGPVQVAVNVAGSKITGVSVLQYPASNGTDAQINGYALPILVDETMSAQSADIDMVSGATYTSNGYQQSLQSALDRAGL